MKSLLKKREEKLKDKEEKIRDKGRVQVTEEERVIMKKVKGKKKDVKRAKAIETDEFDGLLEKYKSKLLKRIKTGPSKGVEGPAFEELEMSDD